MSLKTTILLSVVVFAMLSIFFLIQHEMQSMISSSEPIKKILLREGKKHLANKVVEKMGNEMSVEEVEPQFIAAAIQENRDIAEKEETIHKILEGKEGVKAQLNDAVEPSATETLHTLDRYEENKPGIIDLIDDKSSVADEKKGLLICDGKPLDSEIIYWKIVPGDKTFESPITPHRKSRNFAKSATS